jgi:hypothetical protein
VPFQKSKLCNRRIFTLQLCCYFDCLTHDTAAVYLFQKSLISCLKETGKNEKKNFLMRQHFITKIRKTS